MADAWESGARAHTRPPLVIRPMIPWLAYATFGTLMAAVLGLMVVAYLVITSIATVPKLQGPTVVATFLGIVALLALGGLRLFLVSRFASLQVERQELVWTNGLGVRRRINSDRVDRIYQASFDISIRSYAVMSYFLFLDRSGRTIFKLPTKWWPQEGIDAVGAAVGVPVNGAMGVLSGPAFRSAFPGSIPWVVAHPRLAAALVGPLFVVVLLAIIAVVSLLQGSS